MATNDVDVIENRKPIEISEPRVSPADLPATVYRIDPGQHLAPRVNALVM